MRLFWVGASVAAAAAAVGVLAYVANQTATTPSPAPAPVSTVTQKTPPPASTTKNPPAPTILIPGHQDVDVLFGQPLTLQAPTGGTITSEHVANSPSGPIPVNADSWTMPDATATTSYFINWTDDTGHAQETILQVTVS